LQAVATSLVHVVGAVDVALQLRDIEGMALGAGKPGRRRRRPGQHRRLYCTGRLAT
jgi:hypothetical protein